MAGRARVPKWERTLRLAEQSPRQKPTSARAPLLDVEGAAAFLSVSKSFVRRMICAGKMDHNKLGGTIVRFTQADLGKFVEDGRRESTA